ncbi:MAG: thiamine phosphate synthase [Thermoanaerobaculia bacterium]|nr:thiamine phosphate synthase [Thermoanaerobaculia bacterium]
MPAREGSLEPGTRLYAIADAECLGTDPREFAECVAAMVRGGVQLVQLRLKPSHPDLKGDDALRFQMIECTLERLEKTGSTSVVELWLDDRADLAALFPGAFAGVHVGQSDLPPGAVRRVDQQDRDAFLVGRSCHDIDQVKAADADAAVDWIAIGPVYSTKSKANPEPHVGIEGVRGARAATAKPLVAIGGIREGRFGSILRAGADTAAVLSALVAGGRKPSEIETTARRLVEEVESAATGMS